MPTNNSVTNKPKYRKQLNEQQVDALLCLYKFRFGTAELIGKFHEVASVRDTNKRLKILLEQEYIGRNYDGSYRIDRRQASYYLLPKGIKLLKSHKEHDLDPKGLNLLYYNRSASEGFVNHCLDVFRLYFKIKSLYGDSMRFFASSELAQYGDEMFPRPRPDAYLRLEDNQVANSTFMLDILGNDIPWFTLQRRVRRYFRHYGEDWSISSQGDYHILLLVCEDTYLEQQVRRMTDRLINKADFYEDLRAYTTTMKALLDAKSLKTAIWSDVTEPEDVVSLGMI
jgi:hypothetical protein